MESPAIPLYKQPWFWVGLMVLLVLIGGILILKKQSQSSFTANQILTREDLLRALSAGTPLPVSDEEKEQLAKDLTSPQTQNITPEDRNKLLKLLK